jgi:hypothetical protein
MRSLAIVFVAVIAVAFTVTVFPQKKESPPFDRFLIEQMKIETEHPPQFHHYKNQNVEQFRNEQGLLSANRKRDRFAKVLSDTMYLQISHVFEIWDTLTSTWINNSNNNYAYDANGNRTEILLHSWKNSIWVNSYKYRYSYDVNGNMTEILLQSWKDSVWVNEEKYIYTYDVNGNMAEILFQSWKSIAWVNGYKHSFSYDVNGNMTEVLFQSWNSIAWVIDFKNIYSYDANGNCTEEILQTWESSAWVNISKYSYSYDVNGNRIEEIKQTWYTSAWIINYKYNYSYDLSRNLVLVQSWQDSIWVNEEKNIYTYDSNGYKTEWIQQYWYDIIWINEVKNIYKYDSSGHQTEWIEQFWPWNGSKWVNGYKYTDTWQMLVTDVNQQANSISSFGLSANYPNPFNPQTKISFSIPKESYITLKVYDLLGKEVAILAQEKKEAGEYSVVWNAGSVPSGVYFYRLVAGNFVETKKMILMK